MRFIPTLGLSLVGILAGAVGWVVAPSDGAWKADSGIQEGVPRPDLQLWWLQSGNATREVPLLPVEAGSKHRFAVRIRNVGEGVVAEAMILSFTPLGPYGPARGTGEMAAAAAQDLEIELVPATGMRELCIVAELRPKDLGDPLDAHPEDNRVCRGLLVHEPTQPPTEN